jgi:hypothetical protein
MIYIVGAGWYGCHIAMELLRQQAHGHEIRLVDKANAFFTGSSARNQNRLHLGYHYPRSEETIQECRDGFTAFKTTYPTLSTPLPNNLYLLASTSQTSVAEFSRRFNHSGELLCMEGRTPFSKICGTKPTMFPVAEEYIDNVAAAAFFKQHLEPFFVPIQDPSAFESIETLRRMLGMREEDWVINCTYNQLDPIEMDQYELYCSLVYRIPSDPFAITIMDGPYFSIYPYDIKKQLYTVTSVPHGVVWRGTDRSAAIVSEPSVRSTIESQVLQTLPEFPTYAYDHCFFSWKTKPVTTTDDRSLRWKVTGRTISVYGGKITGMFEAARRVLEIVKS